MLQRNNGELTLVFVQEAGENAQSVQAAPSNVHINPLYSAGQLQAALAAAERAAQSTCMVESGETSAKQDAAKQAAAARIRKWTDVMKGMATGSIFVGSRQPLKNVPMWVTPEVARGGFATGRHAAGGDLQSHEVALARAVGLEPSRRALAAYCMTDAGLSHLQDLLATGAYKVSPSVVLHGQPCDMYEATTHAYTQQHAWLHRS